MESAYRAHCEMVWFNFIVSMENFNSSSSLKKMQCLLCLVERFTPPGHVVQASEWSDYFPKPNQTSIHHLLHMHHQVMGSESHHQHNTSESCRGEMISSFYAVMQFVVLDDNGVLWMRKLENIIPRKSTETELETVVGKLIWKLLLSLWM